MGLFNKNKEFSRYPSCDHLNCALDAIFNDYDDKAVIEEICWAIVKADGYFYDHIKEKLIKHGYDKFVK